MDVYLTICFLGFFGMVLILGATLLFATGLLLYRAIASVSWPMTLGSIVGPKKENEESKSAAVEFDVPFTATGFSYEAKVAYEYTVDGKRHVCSSIRAGDFSSTKPNRALRLAAKYPAGTQVTVYYNPSNPEDAVLEPGLPKTLFVALGSTACVIFFFGLCGILVNVGLMTVDMELITYGIPFAAGILLGGLLSIATAHSLMAGWSSRNWPHTDGRVAFAYVRADSTSTGTLYEANVAYQYTVQGTGYGSSNISYKAFEFDGRQIVERYPAGEAVSVYYDPQHPERAVLEPGIHWSGVLVMLLGLAFFGLGVSILRF